MGNTIYTKIYDAPPIDKDEILRYAGVRELTPDMEIILEQCLDEIDDKLIYRVCWGEFSLSAEEDFLDVGFAKLESKDLAKNLNGCSSVVVFAATVGIEIDRQIARYGAVAPTKALFFQAIGAERIESLCNLFCMKIEEEKQKLGKGTRPRFSAGYGDLSIYVQNDIFRVLNPQKRIGLALGKSMLMSPSKSVTAIIGISDNAAEMKDRRDCKSCNKTDCSYRRDASEDN